MDPDQARNLAADFRSRAENARASGFNSEATTWHLAAALLLNTIETAAPRPPKKSLGLRLVR